MAFIPPSCCGAGYFHRLRRALGGRVDARAVELPGHGRRHLEQPLTAARAAVRDVAERLPARLDAVYGESLGAYIGLALTESLTAFRTGSLGVPRLLVAANSPPSVRPPRTAGPPGTTDDAGSLESAVADLRAMGAQLPDEILIHPHLGERTRAMILGDLRLSWSMIEATRATAVAADVHVLVGEDDPATVAPDAWARHTEGRCAVTRIPGGHLLSAENPRAVADWIALTLGR